MQGEELNEIDVKGKLFLRRPLPGMGRRLTEGGGNIKFREDYFKC